MEGSRLSTRLLHKPWSIYKIIHDLQIVNYFCIKNTRFVGFDEMHV